MLRSLKHWKHKLFFLIGAAMFWFGFWQMDVIAIRQTWDVPGWSMGYYEMGRIGGVKVGMTNGTGYCLTQVFIFFGWLISVFVLWLWDED